MKRRTLKIVALTLALVMLAGCGLPGFEPDGGSQGGLAGMLSDTLSQITDRASMEHNPDGVMFSDMRYARPDTEGLANDVAAVESALEGGESLKRVEELLDRCMDDYDDFSTMYSLANIYNCKDLRDEYYAAEYEWISTESSEVSRLFDQMYYACAGSALGQELEEDYFWDGFCEEYADPDDSYYNDETVALMQRESELVSRYRELVADPTVTYDGEERSFNELIEELSNAEDLAGYYRYIAVLLSYYRKYNEPLAEIYIDLMRVRTEMAEKMGFDSCEEMEYVFCFERDYSPEDGAVFVEGVKRELVPIYLWAKDLSLSYGISYASLSSEALYADMQAVARNIGHDCSEAFSFMSRYGLYDIEPSVYKADTSFQTYLSNYDAPFIFLKPKGTTTDLLTFVHEFGHYTDAYVNFDANETIDVAEIFSQALEFLSLSHMDGVLPDREIERLREGKMIDALDTYIQQSAFAEFESRVHAVGPDELTAEKINEIALQAAKDFGFCEEGFEEYYKYYWMDITHFFEYPFYVISYPVSLSVAMQIYELELQRSGRGLAKYFEILPRDWESFMETVSNGGLRSPFEEDSIDSIAVMIGDALGYEGPLADAA
ncbi:MAG: hypothetical protein IJH48_01075 [Oscillospiraceae bacterium]|nr:hypothetical protein [Oscillospiraceae bacterium]